MTIVELVGWGQRQWQVRNVSSAAERREGRGIVRCLTNNGILWPYVELKGLGSHTADNEETGLAEVQVTAVSITSPLC